MKKMIDETRQHKPEAPQDWKRFLPEGIMSDEEALKFQQMVDEYKGLQNLS